MAERVVFDGKIVSAAGVSAGIDMALALAARIAGDHVAQAIQLGIEYDPQPPFEAGSPEKAPAEVVALLRGAAVSSSASRRSPPPPEPPPARRRRPPARRRRRAARPGAASARRAPRAAAISERAKGKGALSHRFYANADGSGALVVDEWESAEAFQQFFAESQDIGAMMGEAGVTSEPEASFWRQLDTPDTF